MFLISEQTYDPSKITVTANGNPINFTGNKVTTRFAEDTKFEMSIAGKVCPPTIRGIFLAFCDDHLDFSLETDKDTVCEGSDVELSLVASGDYDVSKVSATANGKPITLTDGKYSSKIEETTKFEVAITNADGTKTTLEKTVEVEKRLRYNFNWDVNCETNEVEFFFKSDVVYDPSQIIAVVGGEPVIFENNKATTPFFEGIEYSVEVWGKVCLQYNTSSGPVVSKCKDKDCDAPVVKPIDNMVFCYKDQPGFKVELDGDVKADRLEIYGETRSSFGGKEKIVVESAEPTNEFTVEGLNGMSAMEIVDMGFPISVVAINGECESEPVIVNLNYETSPSFRLSVEKAVVCEGESTFLEIDKSKTYNAACEHTYMIEGDDGSTYDDKSSVMISPKRKTAYTVTAVGKYCKEPVSKTISVDIDPYCEDPVFTLKASKTLICMTDDVELSLEATGPYAESWVSATANGSPISFTDGRYTATFTETTDIEVLITRPSGNVTRLQKTIEVETKPEFFLDYETDCDTKSVELSIVSDQNYAPSQISATANGKKITMVGGKYSSQILRETTFEVTVEGNSCPGTTSSAIVSLENCDQENCTVLPVLKPIADMTFCDDANPKFNVELKREKADRIEITSPALADKIVIESAEQTSEFAVEIFGKTAMDFAGSEIKVVAMNGECASAPVKFRIRHDAEPSAELADAFACEGFVTRMKVSASARYQYVWTNESDDVLGRSQIYSTVASESRHLNVKVINGSCSKTLEADLKVAPNPFIEDIQIDGETNEIVVFANGGSGSYLYDFGYGNQDENVLSDISFGRNYKVKVTDESGCTADTLFFTGVYDIVVPPFFTPNGDGDNDVWRIKNIDKYPSAKVTIYNRFGKVIAKSNGGNDYKPWDGTYNGNPMISDDYWYVIDISIIDVSYSGHFTLLRD